MEKEDPFKNPFEPLKESLLNEDKIKLNREWSFWENYEEKMKTNNQSIKTYSKLLEKLFTFNDIISFWQFWNKYPGANPSKIFYNGESIKYFFKEKFRITALNLFEKNIRPEWEDIKNKNGKVIALEYKIDNDKELESFFNFSQKLWLDLMLSVIGENIICSEYINGIRFIDKTIVNSNIAKILYRIEIWVNKEISKEILIQFKEYCEKTFKCDLAIIKDITVS